MPPLSIRPTSTSSVSLSQKTIQQWVDEGAVHYKAGQYEEALTCLEQALTLDSRSAQNNYLKGMVLLQLGRLWEAMAAFDEAIELRPKFAEAYISKGDIYYSHFGNKKEALDSYQDAIRVAPKLALGYYKMGIVLEDERRDAEAVEAYNTALRFEPRNLEIYFRKAHFYEQRERFEAALATYSDAIQSVPHPVKAYIKKGELFERLQRYEEALTIWNQIILLEPGSSDAYYRKARLLEKLDRNREALAVWNQIILLEPATTDAYFPKVRSLLRFEHYQEALTTLQQIIQIDHRSDSAYFMKGKTLEMLKGDVLRYEDNPGEFEAIYNRLFLRKQYQDVLEAYDQAIHLSPENSIYYISRGNVLKHLGRIKEAIEAYEKGIELEEAEKLKETKDFEKGIQPMNAGNRRFSLAGKSTKRDNQWFTRNKSLVEKQPLRVYFSISNPLIILALLGFILQSWLAPLIVFLCVAALTILFFKFAQRLYVRLDATSWLILAAVASIVWVFLPLLSIPNSAVAGKVILVFISLLIGFLGNAFIYLFLEIYVGILDRIA